MAAPGPSRAAPALTRAALPPALSVLAAGLASGAPGLAQDTPPPPELPPAAAAPPTSAAPPGPAPSPASTPVPHLLSLALYPTFAVLKHTIRRSAAPLDLEALTTDQTEPDPLDALESLALEPGAGQGVHEAGGGQGPPGQSPGSTFVTDKTPVASPDDESGAPPFDGSPYESLGPHPALVPDSPHDFDAPPTPVSPAPAPDSPRAPAPASTASLNANSHPVNSASKTAKPGHPGIGHPGKSASSKSTSAPRKGGLSKRSMTSSSVKTTSSTKSSASSVVSSASSASSASPDSPPEWDVEILCAVRTIDFGWRKALVQRQLKGLVTRYTQPSEAQDVLLKSRLAQVLASGVSNRVRVRFQDDFAMSGPLERLRRARKWAGRSAREADCVTDSNGFGFIHGAFKGTPSAPCQQMTGTLVLKDQKLSCAKASADIHFVSPEGWAVISDLDDTLRDSHVLTPSRLLANTFLNPFAAVPGMADLYKDWAQSLVHSSPAYGAAPPSFHYVSSSPHQLFGLIFDFLNSAGFPSGSLHLRNFSVWDLVTFKVTKAATVRHKTTNIEHILDRLPGRQVLLVGDSGEIDPEIYGGLARAHPAQVAGIFIRRVPLADPARDALIHRPERFELAFGGVPRDKWVLFDDPAELRGLAIRDGQIRPDEVLWENPHHK